MTGKLHAFCSILLAMSGGAAIADQAQDGAIRIDVGRQLFVDDELIGSTTLARTFHQARVHPASPVLRPETAVERDESHGFRLPVAAPFDDGAWYDPRDRRFKMWYMSGWFDGVCYAESRDGLTWERPKLDVVPGTNRVLPVREVDGHVLERDAVTVWLDQEAADPAQRFKMSVYSRKRGVRGESEASVFTSPDGIHWPDTHTPTAWYGGDNSSFYRDAFRKTWVHSIREHTASLRHPETPKATVRARFRYESKDFFKGFSERNRRDVSLWLKADERDRPDPELGYEPELYDVTANAYESLMVGLFGIFVGPPNDVAWRERRSKVIDLHVGFSRDGVHFARPADRRPLLAAARTPGAWNRAYLHPATGVCLVVGDELWFYFGAWSGVSPTVGNHIYAGGSTGLAVLRRDGFASLDAGKEAGTATTRPVVFAGKHLFVNVDAPRGELRAEVVGDDGQPIPPFTLAKSRPLRSDTTRGRMTWEGTDDLSALAGRPVRFRFRLADGKLYSFWVTPDANGASHGYVAAGGPGFVGPTDTVGGDVVPPPATP